MMLPFTDGLMITSPYDPECARLADRHYSRRTPGAPQFTQNGRKLVLRDARGEVVFVWMFALEQYRLDHQAGYNCTLFRNESTRASSSIILEAECFAIDKWGPGRFYTYVDPRKIRSTNPGYCFLMAGWYRAGLSKKGKVLLVKEPSQ